MTRTNDSDDETSGTDDAADEAGDREPVPLRTDRRDYLRAVGGIGATGIVGSLTAPAATAQSNLDEAAADQRIRDNQTGPVTVEVVDENGDPVSGASVDVEMIEHDFVWGAEVAADLLTDQYSEGDPYVDNFLELFNTAVLENAHKWAIWEGNTQSADEAVDWLVERGFDIRGHTCIYPVDYAIPGDLQTAIDTGDAQQIRDLTMQHIEDIITRYGDDVMEWDVVNEVVHRGLIQEGVYGDQIDLEDLEAGAIQPWRSQLLADWFAQAESVIDENGLDVDIVTNDYNTITWANDREKYAQQVEHLQNEGVGVDGIGLQAHIGALKDGSDSWSYANVDSVFEHYAQFDTNVRITEYDMTGDDWTDQQQRADVMRTFLKTAYGHPNVDEFTVWGFWDNAHWRDEAPFFQEDWSEKPALDVFRSLVHDEWWTDESGTTDGSGTVTVDAFLGEHEILVDGEVVGTVSVTSPGGTTVQVDGSGGALPEPTEQQPYGGSPTAIPGRLPVEEFDDGGPGVAYSDATTENEGGDFRTDTAVDVRSASPGTGYALGNVESDEWLEYTVDVQQSGSYDLEALVASDAGGGAFHLEVDGTSVSETVTFEATGGWTTWETVGASGVELSAGQQVIRLVADDSWWDLNYVDLSLADGSDDADLPSVGDDANAPTDPDGDGLYEDVNGNDDGDLADAVDLFQHRESPAVQENVEAYDFSGNGGIDLADVVELFRENTN